MKRLTCLILVLIMLLSLCITAQAKDKEITILFTHDLHSHLLPSPDEDGGEFGGYARLTTVIKEQKSMHPNAILVDGGDFSMGSLFQTAYPTSAIELRMMGAMGYDVTTFGNHEYDYLRRGLSSMLNSAKNSGDALPFIVEANYLPKKKDKKTTAAFENYGVDDYVIIEKNGVYFVVFGVFGLDADECAPNSKMVLSDAVETSKKVIKTATEECKDKYGAEPVVICLSHSGTEDGAGEDYDLAQQVPEIDVIVSGHTHTTLDKPIQVNDTYIVSAGEYGRNLGAIKLKKSNDGYSLSSYELIPVDENVKKDKEIAKKVKDFKKNVEEDYLSKYGVSFDEVLVNNRYKFDSVDEVYATQHESTLGNVFSDAYKWAVESQTGERVDVALTAAGVIRETLPKGNVTVSDVFNAASLGVGTEGELVAVYISGKDLKNALEVDASVQPIMNSAQLFFSGVEYSFNTYRMIFNKVDFASLRRENKTEEIEDDKLYKIVTGMYCGQMLGAVEDTSMGLLSITPKDENGNPIAVSDLKNYVVKDKNGNPIKEWYAIASYLKTMGGQMDAKYSSTDGRKVVYSSLNPADMLRNPNKFTFIAIAVILLVILLIVFIVRKIIRKKKHKKVI